MNRVSTPPTGKVFVLQIGRTHYFVVDPDYEVMPYFSFQLLFTRNWVLVTRQGS